jgi:hypothetical protein
MGSATGAAITGEAIMQDTSHLVVLQERLSRERARLAEAKTEKQKAFHQVKVAQAEREIEGEMKFLGMDMNAAQVVISDDDLLAELGI